MAHQTQDVTWTVPDAHGGGTTTTRSIKGDEIIFIVHVADRHEIYSLAAVESAGLAGDHAAGSTGDGNDGGGSSGSSTKGPLLPVKLDISLATTLDQQSLERYLVRGPPTYLQTTTTTTTTGSHERAQAEREEGGPARRIYVLISTGSGIGLARRFYDFPLKRCLAAVGLDEGTYDVVETQSEESVRTFARDVLFPRAVDGVEQTLIVLAGDGAMVDVLAGLFNDRDALPSSFVAPTIALLPLGTGNALFQSTHRTSPIPSAYVKALRTLFRGTPRPLPIFAAQFSAGARMLSDEGRNATPLSSGVRALGHERPTIYGAVVASYGLHSTLVADSDTAAYRAHGDKRFAMVAQDLLHPEKDDDNPDGMPHAYRADVTLYMDGSSNAQKVPRSEHAYILASMVSHLQEGFCISPSSQPLDGTLRVLHFGVRSGDDVMAIMNGAFAGGEHVASLTEKRGNPSSSHAEANVEVRDEAKGEVQDDGDATTPINYQPLARLRLDMREPGADPRWRRCCVDGLIVAVEEQGFMEVQTCAGLRVVELVVDVEEVGGGSLEG